MSTTFLVLAGIIGGIGVNELLIIGVILLLLFGGKKIPELMKGLGKGVKEFKDSQKEEPESKADQNSTEDKKI